MKKILAASLFVVAGVLLVVGGGRARASHQDATQDQKDPKVAYNAYVGEYQVQPGFTLTMTNEGGKLMGKPTGDPKVEFKPEADADQFYSTEAGVRLKFARNAEGAVTGVQVTLDGKDYWSKKIK